LGVNRLRAGRRRITEAKAVPGEIAPAPKTDTAPGVVRIDAGVRPASDDRCAECGDPVGLEWVSYRGDPDTPSRVLKHFGGVVHTGPVEPPRQRPERAIRDFAAPKDLGVFFHRWCAPRVEMAEELKQKLVKILAEALVADFKERSTRWATGWQPSDAQGDPPRYQTHVTARGRRVFTMSRLEWRRFRADEGKLVEVDLDRTAAGSVGEAAATIASLAADCSVGGERIEVWRYHPTEPPTALNVQEYVVLDSLARRINVATFAECASTDDSLELRKYLDRHVFLVKARADKSRWQPKARKCERIVFLHLRLPGELPPRR
jgi:hypothetical protein